MRNLSKYIGRSYNVYNCFDLVKEFYQDEYGITLKDYFEGEVPDRKTIECLVVSNKGDFIQVPTPLYGDIVVIRLFGYASHVGICVGEGRFIHSMRGVGSAMDLLPRYGRMIEGFYRHRKEGWPND